MKPLVIIPTLNERENIPVLIQKIKSAYPDFFILVVDDNSEDGTAAVVQELRGEHPNLNLICRKKKQGLGASIVEGFEYALAGEFDPIITMDGDLSHDPAYLKDFLKYSLDYDLVIGSRYAGGVRVDGWRFRKLLISKLANMYVAYLLVKPIWDFTSGYRIYTRRFLKEVDFDEVPTEGYLFQIHMVYQVYAKGLKVREVPFLYKELFDRGSKLPPKDIRLTFFKVLKYRAPFLEILRHFTYVKKDYQRFVSEYEELLSPPALKNINRLEISSEFNLSIGIMAYNEEMNISHCLSALEQQKLSGFHIKEIMVVSSGSIDGTNDIVREYQKNDKKIKLIIQEERKGKASAINQFLQLASGDICVLESADTVAEPDCLEHLIQPFHDARVGIAGAHPVPINNRGTFIGFCVKKMWHLHHLRASDQAKCGEMIAFRNILQKIPSYTAVDEAVIESLITTQGYRAVYVAEALLKNKGAENLRDFWKQRVRIVAGHKHLASAKRYKVSTYHSMNIIKYLFNDFSWHPRDIIFLIGMVMLEASARICGSLNFYLRDKNPYIWDIARSTKNIHISKNELGDKITSLILCKKK